MKSSIGTSLVPVYSPIVAAEGAYFTLADGTTFADLSSQTLNLSLGQSHPVIERAVINQLQAVQFASSQFGTPVFLELCDKLVELAPHEIKVAILKLSNGSDAVETAIKLARLHTRRHNVACLPGAWHGESYLSLGLSSAHRLRLLASQDIAIFAEQPTFTSLTHLVRTRANFAAAIVDPVAISNGLVVDRLPEQLQELRAACDDTGTSLIFDEVQTFGGYLGSSLFASEYTGVTPDIICLGKALGAGYPLAAVLCRDQYRSILQYNDAEFTYGGHPVSCAAALAAIKLLQYMRTELRARSDAFATILRQVFASRAIEVRCVGLMATIALVDDVLREAWVSNVVQLAIKDGLFVRSVDRQQRILLKPPIALPIDEMRDCLRRLSKHCEKASKSLTNTIPAVEARNRSFPDGTILRKVSTPNPNEWYVKNLLAAYSSKISLKARSPEEQQQISRKLISIGVPAVPLYVSPDGREEAIVYRYQEGTSMATLLADTSVPFDLINAISLRHYEIVIMAHDNGMVIGDRWPGNALVSSRGSVHLIDMELTYDGPIGDLCLLEETFVILHTIALIPDSRAERSDLQLRLLVSMVSRHGEDLSRSSWQAIARFYLSTKRVLHAESSDEGVYRTVLEDDKGLPWPRSGGAVS